MTLNIAPEVAQAVAAKQAVVALESTIISHGMPYPENVATALKVEAAVRAHGAIPATIALIDGVPTAGISPAQIERLGKAGTTVEKVSRRDFQWVMSQKLHGATTVAATMIIAEKAGIAVFATGGIGGVHRAGETTFDISADLPELSRTSVAVVSAGVKSILDLPKTLEYLETHGVPVLGYQTSEFPAFYTRESGLSVDRQVDTPEEIAEMLRIKWAFGLKGGVLIANPVPLAHALPKVMMDEVIEQALTAAREKNITGKAITPFLLDKVKTLTNQQSLATNIELVLNNAQLAAKIAVAYAKGENF